MCLTNRVTENWPKALAEQLRKHSAKHLDSVIDSGGGNIMGEVGSILKAGGLVVCYGMLIIIPFWYDSY